MCNSGGLSSRKPAHPWYRDSSLYGNRLNGRGNHFEDSQLPPMYEHKRGGNFQFDQRLANVKNETKFSELQCRRVDNTAQTSS